MTFIRSIKSRRKRYNACDELATSLPTKLYYSPGERFDRTGLVITAVYDNGEKCVVTDYTLSGDIASVGEKTITVTYGDLTTTFTVCVCNTTDFSGGLGTANWPYLIGSKTELNKVRNNRSAHYKLVADIEFTASDFASGGSFYNSGKDWTPIGDSSTKFTGSFDGNGHTIKGLKQNISTSSNSTYGGLFGYTSGATIKNLAVTDANEQMVFHFKTGHDIAVQM